MAIKSGRHPACKWLIAGAITMGVTAFCLWKRYYKSYSVHIYLLSGIESAEVKQTVLIAAKDLSSDKTPFQLIAENLSLETPSHTSYTCYHTRVSTKELTTDQLRQAPERFIKCSKSGGLKQLIDLSNASDHHIYVAPIVLSEAVEKKKRTIHLTIENKLLFSSIQVTITDKKGSDSLLSCMQDTVLQKKVHKLNEGSQPPSFILPTNEKELSACYRCLAKGSDTESILLKGTHYNLFQVMIDTNLDENITDIYVTLQPNLFSIVARKKSTPQDKYVGYGYSLPVAFKRTLASLVITSNQEDMVLPNGGSDLLIKRVYIIIDTNLVDPAPEKISTYGRSFLLDGQPRGEMKKNIFVDVRRNVSKETTLEALLTPNGSFDLIRKIGAHLEVALDI